MPTRIVILLLLFLMGCKGGKKAKRIESHIRTKATRISLGSGTKDSLHLYYTGCAGFLMRLGDQALLHDPFFSNLGPLLAVNSQETRTDTALVDAFFQKQFHANKDLKGLIKWVLVSHTHYDHAMDVPYIFHRKLNRDSVQILGSESMHTLMKASVCQYPRAALQGQEMIPIQPGFSHSDTLGQAYYSQNGRIRVWPIKSHHAPHFYGLHFYKGPVDPELTCLPTKAPGWKEGATYAFMIDFLSPKGEILFRVYTLGAAAKPPLGFPPPALLKQKKVDVAVLCVASHAYVSGYPEEIIRYLKPQHMILSHWENFFRPLKQLKEEPLVVPFTNAKKFIEKVQAAALDIGRESEWTLPNPCTEMIFTH